MSTNNSSNLLGIDSLKISVNKTAIVHEISLSINAGEVHAIMGPNGSGKSTLVSTLMGHPAYRVDGGSVVFDNKNLLQMTTDERARAGLFLAFQYPKEIAGVSLRSFLFASAEAQRSARNPDHRKLSPVQFAVELKEAMASLGIDPAFAERAVNKGFSGGEKKKAEVLQMKILKPTLALLDETDSGLDVDALKIVGQGLDELRGPAFSAIVVTHYARLLEYIKPDKVHVMVRGKIVESGGPELAKKLEQEGYVKYGRATIPLE